MSFTLRRTRREVVASCESNLGYPNLSDIWYNIIAVEHRLGFTIWVLPYIISCYGAPFGFYRWGFTVGVLTTYVLLLPWNTVWVLPSGFYHMCNIVAVEHRLGFTIWVYHIYIVIAVEHRLCFYRLGLYHLGFVYQVGFTVFTYIRGPWGHSSGWHSFFCFLLEQSKFRVEVYTELLPKRGRNACHDRFAPLFFWGSSISELKTSPESQAGRKIKPPHRVKTTPHGLSTHRESWKN